jgi:poly(ribitol-phosphate) beta-N-acetylglucosaminyltransferase
VGVKVTVVVPVYNPGPHIDRLVKSLQNQTMPADQFEAIFVDDGSTDGTGERLDRLAERHAHFSTIHIPNSGWPGRPRNVGIDAASGEFIFFIDNDDWFGTEALQRAYQHARAYGSDVVVAKEVGRGRAVPFDVFRETRPSASLVRDNLLEMLTPHKMFRRSFLLEHDIRFPEGRRRLEDHLFVITAYFQAHVISILADYPYYFWSRRDDGTNAANTRIDPVGYFGNMEEALDVVDANTEPGPERDRLLVRWYRGKVLARLGGRKLLRMPPDYREKFVAVVLDLTERRFGLGVDEFLPPHLKVRSALLRANRPDELQRLAEGELGMRGTVRLEQLRWNGDDLMLEVEAGVAYADGSPVAYSVSSDRNSWIPPVDLDPSFVTLQLLEAGAAYRESTLTGAVRNRSSQAVYALESTVEQAYIDQVGGLSTPRVRGWIRLNPSTAMGGRRLGSTSDLLVRIKVAGWEFTPRLGADRSEQATAGLRPRIVGGRQVVPYWTQGAHNLSIKTRPARGPALSRRTRAGRYLVHQLRKIGPLRAVVRRARQLGAP